MRRAHPRSRFGLRASRRVVADGSPAREFEQQAMKETSLSLWTPQTRPYHRSDELPYETSTTGFAELTVAS